MRQLYERLCRVELAIAMICLAVSTGLIFTAAVLRYLGHPLNWSLEVSMFVFAWCVFLSADVALRENRMVNFDLLVQRLPKHARAYLNMFCYTLILVFLAVLVYYGLQLTWKTRMRNFQGIEFSYAWVTLSLPVAALLMGITTVRKIAGFRRELVDGPQAEGGQ